MLLLFLISLESSRFNQIPRRIKNLLGVDVLRGWKREIFPFLNWEKLYIFQSGLFSVAFLIWSPSIVDSPSVGRSKQPKMCNKVHLPEPERPSAQTSKCLAYLL